MARDGQKSLSGMIEADNTYFGRKGRSGRRDRGAGSKQPFLAAVEVGLENRPKKLTHQLKLVG